MNNLKKLSLVVVALHSLQLFGWGNRNKEEETDEQAYARVRKEFKINERVPLKTNDQKKVHSSPKSMTDEEEKLNTSEDLDRTFDCCKDVECSCCCCTIL